MPRSLISSQASATSTAALFAGQKLVDQDMAGQDLTGADLRGADLSRAKLIGTNLLGAKLAGATLFEADLSEAELAERVQALLAVEVPALAVNVPRFEARTGLRLAPAQRAAVELAAEAPLMVLTGGPGTGKTTIVKAVLHHLQAALYQDAVLAQNRHHVGHRAQRHQIEQAVEIAPARGAVHQNFA